MTTSNKIHHVLAIMVTLLVLAACKTPRHGGTSFRILLSRLS